MKLIETEFKGLYLFERTVYEDDRGFLAEIHRSDALAEVIPGGRFVQCNHTRSHDRTLRGLHFQKHHPQGKLLYPVSGKIFDVAVDLRERSATYLKHFAITLNADEGKMIYIPPGFAHGYCVIEGHADLVYFLSDYYHPEDQAGIIWNDRSLAIPWPPGNYIISEKDLALPQLTYYIDSCR